MVRQLAVSTRAGATLTLACLVVTLGAQQDRSQQTYPAQQREPGESVLIARGQALYGINCRACHGTDLRGGDLGGPNLLRSQLVLRDQEAELIGPVIQDGQTSPGSDGMPPQNLSDDDIQAVVEFIHSIVASAERQGSPPAGEPVELVILVGDVSDGQAYFEATCASCHSPSGDLAGIASRIPEPQELQNTWVRGGADQAERPKPVVVVTLPSGERFEGQLDRLDDFLVALTQPDRRQRSFTRRGDVPGVEVSDPMARHTDLLSVYRDTDIHDVTAYLSTLR